MKWRNAWRTSAKENSINNVRRGISSMAAMAQNARSWRGGVRGVWRQRNNEKQRQRQASAWRGVNN